MQRIFAAHHERRLVLRRQFPLPRLSRSQVKAASLPVVKAPFSPHHAGQIRRQAVEERAASSSRPPCAASALRGRSTGPLLVSMCNVSWCASCVENTSGAPSAASTRSGFCAQIALRWIHRMQGRRFGGAHRRQRDHHHRFGIAEGGRHVQPQVQRILRRQRQSRNVLEVRRVQRGRILAVSTIAPT